MITKRNIVACIIFSLITCGIYSLYWFVKITDETNFASGNPNETSGIAALLFTVITCGIYTYYWAYKMGAKVETIEGTNGSKGVLFLILQFIGLGIVVYALAQDTLNKHA